MKHAERPWPRPQARECSVRVEGSTQRTPRGWRRVAAVAVAAVFASCLIASSADPTSGASLAPGVLAWGNNQTGELGDGTTTNQLSPVAMLGVSSPQLFAAGAVHGL